MESHPKPCFECLKRRLACDFCLPACQKCQSRNTQCPGYEKKRLKWLAPGQTRSKGRRARQESNVIRLCLKESSEVGTVLEAIEYYNTHICPDLEAVAIKQPSQSPFFLHPASMPYLPTSLRHTMVAIALAHRILQSSESFESEHAVLSTRLQTHRGDAIRHLRIEIKGASKSSQIALICIMTFLCAEIQQGVSLNWRPHLEAAYAMIDIIGGMPTLILSRFSSLHILRYFILIDIMGSTTSPNVDQHSSRRQLELVGLLPTLYGNGLSTCLPCPPQLLADIILINHMRPETNKAVKDTSDRHCAGLELLRRINSFSVVKWIEEISLHSTGDGEMIVSNPGHHSWDWQSVAYSYQSAVTLYCISSLFDSGDVKYGPGTSNDGQVQDEVDVATMRQKHLRSLLHSLKSISSNPQTQLRKLIIWPLIIAGLELDGSDEASKSFILGELNWMSRTLGTASPLVAIDYLTKLWSTKKGHDWGRWNTLFDRPYVFAM